MKIFVKTLKGTSFEIEAKPEDKVSDVKKSIETSQGHSVYPADQQMLIYQGKILKDDTTIEDNKVTENSFLVIMLSNKNKGSASGTSTATKTPPAAAPPSSTVPATPTVPAPAPTQAAPAPLSLAPAAPTPVATPIPVAAPTSAVSDSTDVYGQAASNLVSGNTLEQTVQQIMDMGGGTWDRDLVIRALRAAFNNPERAVEYLYSGIPENVVEAPPVARAPQTGTGQPAASPLPQAAAQPTAQPAVPSSGPNANPLDLFPQGLPTGGAGGGGAAGSLDMLRSSPQFRTLLALVQSNPQILQPMLQELGKQNPQILRLIQENQAEFLRLVNESNPEGGENLLGQLAGAAPQTIQVTPEEQESIQRLEAMGFERSLVLEVFFACNKNEELAANYLLDHMHEFEEQ